MTATVAAAAAAPAPAAAEPATGALNTTGEVKSNEIEAHSDAIDSAPEVTKDVEVEKSTESAIEPAAEAKDEAESQLANVDVDQQSTQEVEAETAEAVETGKSQQTAESVAAAETPNDAEPADDAAPESQRGTPNKTAEAAMEPSCIKVMKTRKRVADEAAPLEPNKKSKA